MAMKPKYTVDTKGVRANLTRMQTSFPLGAKEAMKKALNAGVRKAKQLSPVDTGKLKASIEIKELKVTPKTVRGSFKAYAENTSGKDYSRYQEAGFTDKSGNWHEGKRFMLAGRRRAEQVLLEESKKQTRRITKK